MARTRNIKPGFFKSEELADCDPLARILFAGLWTQADRDGILEDRPRRIKSECLPYDECDIEEMLAQLAGKGFIVRYEVDGRKCISIPTFRAHQNPHRDEKPSALPKAPYLHGANTVQAPCEHGSSTALTRVPSTLNQSPETLNLKPAQVAGACAEEKAGTKNGDQSSVFDSINVATLKDPARTDAWWKMAAAEPRPVVSATEQDRLRVHGAAERSLDRKQKVINAKAFFIDIVTRPRWDWITQEQEGRAYERIKELDRLARGDPKYERIGEPITTD